MYVQCPLSAAMSDIPQPACPFKLDQIVRMAFQRRQPSGTPPFATLADIQTLTNWTTFKTASDSTKIVLSPLFAGLVIPPSEALTAGGNDNTTIGGIPEYNGEGSVTVTGVFKNLPPATKRALDKLVQESLPGGAGITNLTIYYFNKDGYIFCENPLGAADAATTKYNGVKAFNYRVSSLGSNGLNSPNANNFSLSHFSDWADKLTSVKPAFDPLTDI